MNGGRLVETDRRGGRRKVHFYKHFLTSSDKNAKTVFINAIIYTNPGTPFQYIHLE